MMKHVALLALLAISAVSVNGQMNGRILNQDGQYEGRIIGTPDNQRVLDNNGRFKGRIIQDKNDDSPRIYEMDKKGVLRYKGRIVK